MAADDSAPAAESAVPAATSAPVETSSADWRSGLSPDLLAEKSLADFKDVGGLAKAYVDTKRLVGAPLEPPGADAKPEQISAYRKRLGVPDTHDKYEVSLPTPAEGTGFAWEDTWVNRLKERFHQAHASPKVLQAAIDTFHEYMHARHDLERGKQAAADAQEREQAMVALEQLGWGPRNGPQWNYHNRRAVAVIEHIFGDAAPAQKNAVYEMAANPHFAAGLSRLADGLLERGFISGDEVPSQDVAGAQAKIDALRAAVEKDPHHPIKNRLHPDHERAFKEWLTLHGIVAGPDAWKPLEGMSSSRL
jgi:hypothetical protein